MTQLDEKPKPPEPQQGRVSKLIAPPEPRAHFIFWPIVIIGAVFDLWSKSAVFEWLKNEPDMEFSLIDGLLKFVMRENSGAAFSIARGQTTMLITVSVVALVLVIGFFLFGNVRTKIMQVGLALFAAGIIGNLYDRVVNHGFVRDFIDIYRNDYHWPAFNVADSMLCAAVGLLIIANIISEFAQRPARQQKAEPQDPH